MNIRNLSIKQKSAVFATLAIPVIFCLIYGIVWVITQYPDALVFLFKAIFFGCMFTLIWFALFMGACSFLENKKDKATP